MKYKPSLSSLRKHKVPKWYNDAKFGIFIHWGLYSVPAYAPTGKDVIEVIKTGGFEELWKEMPYSEWYLNTLRIGGNSTEKYHTENFGKDFPYEKFVGEFNEAIKSWDPEAMADLIQKSGAKYSVLVTKHHDGFLMWPSLHRNQLKKDYVAGRDIVGELSSAVKKRGLKMGWYYSSTLDWSFNPQPIKNIVSYLRNGVTTPEYSAYVKNHWLELIDKYDADLLWSDIGYPPNNDVHEITAHFYNKKEEGVLNDRWMRLSPLLLRFLSVKPIAAIVNFFAKKAFTEGNGMSAFNSHYDYVTPEYTKLKKIAPFKWESVRGIGNSFAYNRLEIEKDFLCADDAVKMLVDIVSKNGNLLLNIGPKPDGSVPEIQKQCILGIGRWLSINGEAIYGTRPWVRAEGKTAYGIDVRFTKKGDTLYAMLLDRPAGSEIKINSLQIKNPTKISLLGTNTDLKWAINGKDLSISLPDNYDYAPVYVLQIQGAVK